MAISKKLAANLARHAKPEWDREAVREYIDMAMGGDDLDCWRLDKLTDWVIEARDAK